MRQSLNVLIVEDSEHDTALMIRALRRGGYEVSYERVDSELAMVAAIGKRTWDIVLSDYSMPQLSAQAALAVIANSCIDLPCIVVSGSVGEETAAEVMRAGAQDLVLKHNLKRLPPAVARELEAAQTRRERRAADAKLDQERQLLQQIMREIPDAICFKDQERRYTRLNHAERSILNVQSDAEAIGRTVDQFISPELAQVRRTEEERVLTTGRPLVDCVQKVVAPNGAVRWLSATKAPIWSAEGEIVGIVEIARDITESKRQEQLKSEFVATVSHELRTPLTSIMGSVGYLAGGAAGTLSDSVMRMLKIALGNCHRLVNIVNDILDIEKIETGKMRYDRKPVEVRALAGQVIEANQGLAAEHGVSIHLDKASVTGVVLSDPDRLTQVMTNLVSNAIKFSRRDAQVLVLVERSESLIQIKIRDHGPGIPEGMRARIFEKFVRAVNCNVASRRRNTGDGHESSTCVWLRSTDAGANALGYRNERVVPLGGRGIGSGGSGLRGRVGRRANTILGGSRIRRSQSCASDSRARPA